MKELTMVGLSVYTNHRMGDLYYTVNSILPIYVESVGLFGGEGVGIG